MPAHAADRNLLFGILALQMDFITRDALIAAMQAWTLEKSKPLGRILVDQGALAEDEHALLEPLVARHLEKHGGDPERSLAALNSVGSTREALQQIADPDLQASLRRVSNGQQDDDPYRTSTYVGEPTSAGARFRVLHFHAKGGLGVVSVALDEELDRQVALKEIQGEHADEPESRSRFVQEAEITGKLEHPGIIPVYGLGHYDDGRPFYAMRFIRGDSLRDAIRRFHRADADPRRDPGERALRLRELLGRFLDVCDAVAYAHSRGVLHRDLKPGNVMLGPYGETLVVDWGLAKPTGRADAAAEAMLGPVRLSGTAGGSRFETMGVVGTPAYMSPEQAEGRIDQLGPASDVFSLGATLYHLLTGRAPYDADDGEPLLPKVARGDFPTPRSLKPGVPRALEAVCLKAMAVKPEDRYASPRELADDLKRWLANEPVAAWREPWRTRARRWARRHQTLVTTVATSALIATALGVGAWAWFERRERGIEERAARVAQLALDEANRLSGEARAKGDLPTWEKAVAAAERAGDNLRDIRRNRPLRAAVAATLASTTKGRDAARAEAIARARDRRVLDDLEEARYRWLIATMFSESYGTSEPVTGPFRDAFRAYGIDVERSPVDAVAARIQSSGIGPDLVSAIEDWARASSDREEKARLSAIANATHADPMLKALRDAREADDVPALKKLAREADAARLAAWFATRLGIALVKAGEVEDALQVFAKARLRHPGDFWLNVFSAHAFSKLKTPNFDGELRCLTAALAIRPDRPETHYFVGYCLAKQRRADEAIAYYRRAIELRPDFAYGYFGIAHALLRTDRFDEQVEAFRNAARLQPGSFTFRLLLGWALTNLKRFDEAIAETRGAVQMKPDIAEGHMVLGNVLLKSGRTREAAEELDRAAKMKPGILEGTDIFGDINFYKHLLNANNLVKEGRFDQAIAECRTALEMKPDFAAAHQILSEILLLSGRPAEAIAPARRSVELTPSDPAARAALGLALYVNAKFDEAIAEFRRAIELKPDLALAHSNLGLALKSRGQPDEAIAEFRRAIALEPGLFGAHGGLGEVLTAKGMVEEATAEFRRAVELNPGDSALRFNLGNTLKRRARFEEAIAEFRRAVELKPDFAEAHGNLGLTLQQVGRFPEALDELERCHEIGSKQPAWRYPSEQWVQACRRQVDLDARLPAFLKGEAHAEDADERLALADLCSKKSLYAAAARFFGEAFADRPAPAGAPGNYHRYNAACAAARAGGGDGKDDPPPDDAARAALRARALDWLKADLAAWAEVVEGGPPEARARVAPTLRHWRDDPDLAALRDEAALAKLPDAEREACQKLWADVDTLLERANKPPR